jgi:hypothetical protein
MGVDFNTNKADLTVQVRKGCGISMGGEREGVKWLSLIFQKLFNLLFQWKNMPFDNRPDDSIIYVIVRVNKSIP